jgi:5-formyltetrahydrofolate cyclo-ligase
MNRKGRGKGYYDRFLAGTSAIKVGICFELQLDREFPLNSKSHDIPMNMIITEKGIIHGIV